MKDRNVLKGLKKSISYLKKTQFEYIDNHYQELMATVTDLTKTRLRSPCLIGYFDKIQSNCKKMLANAEKMNCVLRPHVKTHKTLEGALLQTGGRKSKIVVSTLAEAEFFANGGFDDILYAVPITPDKFPSAMVLNDALQTFHVLVDSVEIVSQLSKYQRDNQTKALSVWVMVDCGYHRDGVDPQATASLDLIEMLVKSEGVLFSGIYTHGGHSYGGASQGEVIGIANDERASVVNFAEKIRQRLRDKFSSELAFEIGVGSTPTCSCLPDHLAGVTEMHPGNYIYYDEMQKLLGSCEAKDIAVRILTRVIGKYPEQNMLLVDMGWTGCSTQGEKEGYGRIVGEEHSNLYIKVLKQEAGEIESRDGSPIDFSRYPIGTILEVAPYHSCAATHCHTQIHIFETEKSSSIMSTWKICKGW